MPYVKSILSAGGNGQVIEIECQLSNSLPAIVIVGLGNKAVEEAKERVRSAFASTNIPLPKKRIIINLAPADVPKDSTSFDLPIAAAILQASRQRPDSKTDQAFIGEIGLDGSVRPVRGLIGKIIAGKQSGITTYFIPRRNAPQAMVVPGINIVALSSIRELLDATYTITQSQPRISTAAAQPVYTFDDIAGQEAAKRALEIAAAGSHNILLYGPPGTGKSMLAKCLIGLLPPPSHNEVLEITHLHSLADPNYDALITTRPFRSPHNSSSSAAILGGGPYARPGEISLSHGGVLFLDELPEFNRTTLEALRQPLENKCITISRSRHRVEYPANFMLVATANLCPCGYNGQEDQRCLCTAARITTYRQRLSGPILDRIDLHVTVPPVQHSQILQPPASGISLTELRQRICTARLLQKKRYSTQKTNNEMTNSEAKTQARLTTDATALLNVAANRLGVSARGYIKVIKIARTIADLEQSPVVTTNHITEALQYRQQAVP